MRSLGKNFLAGLIILLPAFVTITILKVVFGWIYGLAIGPVAQLITPWLDPGWTVILVKAGIAVGFILVVTSIGFGTRVILIQRFFSVGENFVKRVPIIGKIYYTMKEISNTFQGGKRGVFNRVVLLEWPRKGLYALGFVTSEGKGEVQEKTPQHVVNVFIPTTPNPTSGYLILADREMLIPLDMSVEDGMRLVISGGVVGPEVATPLKNPA